MECDSSQNNCQILFDGASADKFEGRQLAEDRTLKQGVTSKEKFQCIEVQATGENAANKNECSDFAL